MQGTAPTSVMVLQKRKRGARSATQWCWIFVPIVKMIFPLGDYSCSGSSPCLNKSRMAYTSPAWQSSLMDVGLEWEYKSLRMTT